MALAEPPERHAGLRQRIRRLGAVLAATAVLVTGGIIGAGPASAATLGPGHGDLDTTGTVGSFIAESDGRQVYCMDPGAAAPWDVTTGPTTVTDLISHTGQQLSPETLAKLNYVLSKWGDSPDPDVTAAVQMYVWSVADPVTYNSHGMDGDSWYIGRVPTENRPTVLGNLATMRAEADANSSVNPSVDVEIAMADQFNGTLSVTVSPTVLAGSVVLTDATFTDGTTSKALGTGTYPIVGRPAPGVPEYRVGAAASYGAAGLGARVNLYETPGAQRLLAAGTSAAVTDTAQTPWIGLDFQPTIGTHVASKFVAEGDSFTDQLTVGTVGAGAWIAIDGQPVELTAKGTLYGPFDEQPAEAETAPAGAPIVGTETLLLNGTGEYTSSGSLTATESGFYTWVWGIDQAAQGENGKYIRGSFTDWFGRVTETHVTPFQPEAVSKADARLVMPGDQVTDTLTVSSSNGAWLRVDGENIPVVFDGTAYQVPGTLPPVEQAGVPSDAVPIGQVQVTASGPGVYTSPAVALPDAGFVTWVWEMHLANQPDEYRDFIADDWADNYGIPVESTSVRWPVKVTSEVREYNVHSNGRAFDTVEVTGFPENHGDFTGDGYWGGDLDVITHTVYGPFTTDTIITDDLALEGAPVLTELTTPARNGSYKLGYTDADQIRPTEPGYYVIVSDFAGDDRVRPFQSSPADILERFYVPQPQTPEASVTVTTKATPEAFVGDPISDTAIVEGEGPEGSYLVFRAYGPYAEQPGADDEVEPFFTSDQVLVDAVGEYGSGTTSVDTAGLVFWVETLHSPDGEVLAEGFIGAPGETTIVRDRPADLTVTTRAVPEVTLGEPAHDVAIVDGTVPDGTLLAFEAYRQTGDEAVCDAENLVFDTHDQMIPITGPGEYPSAKVVFEKAGTYFWVETLYSPNGDVLHRGKCGAAGETTKVVATPDTPTITPPVTPPGPSVLASTGGGWSFAGLIAGLALLATGGTLWFGRRLAQHRARLAAVGDGEDLPDTE